jgi:hypothetical protein
MSYYSNSSITPNVPAVTGFLPTDLANLEVWYDADDATTITESSGDVSQWDDKSGNDNHLEQTSGTKQPSYHTGTLNGRAVVRFDGVDENLESQNNTGFTTSDAISVFGVITKTGTFNDFETVISQNGNDLQDSMAFLFGNGSAASPKPAVSTDTWGQDGIQVDATISAGTYLIGWVIPDWSDHFDSPTNNQIRIDKVDQTVKAYGTVAPGTLVNDVWHVGGFDNLSTAFLDGDIAELFVVKREVTATEITRIENYLQNKWGVP